MAKYVKYWNVGGGMKANAYYGSKFLTRKRKYRRKVKDSDLSRKDKIILLGVSYLILMGMLLLIAQ
jgi:hypothetical protein